ncbi:MAG: FAD-binding oxidoreductase [Myxococcales bacterium]|nr:FAD-binding oxidoreductase [Myxococcales bacterium]MCB9715229.1 FAD-binding oxidoreductase [Myxococcales bacterium]
MIVVVGCGVAGLTCAVLLAEAGHEVEIWSTSRPPRTTSNVAAAFWYPYHVYPRERVIGWARTSYRRFRELLSHPDTGIRMHPVRDLYHEPVTRPWWEGAVPQHRRLRPDELPPGFAGGFGFEAPVVDTRHYLPYLLARFAAAGGGLIERTLLSLDEALERSPLVFCCAGLGARTLASDPELFPVRGQLVHVDDPGIDTVLLDEHGKDGLAYVVPRGDHCVLGGTAEPHVDDCAPRPEDSDGIVERCARLDPRLATAPRRAEIVGLRPGRASVRVEAEPRGDGLIVYDYGHGGAGVTLSWGCAEEAVALGRAHLPAPRRRRPA